MPVRKDVEIRIIGKDKLTPATKSAKRSLNDLAKTVNTVTSIALIALATRAVKAGADLVKLGAQSLAARDRLVAFAGGAAEADAMLESLIASSDDTVDRLTATTMAAQLLTQGLVSTTAEIGIAGAMVGKLGNQTWTTERRMSALTMLLANQSTRRLDDFGRSVASVTARQKELERQGYSTVEAFKVAVFAEAELKLGILGDTSDSLNTQLGRLGAAFTDLNLAMATSFAIMAEGGKTVPTVTRWARELAVTLPQLTLMAKAQTAAWRTYYLETGTAAEVQEAFNAVIAEGAGLVDESTAAFKANTQAEMEAIALAKQQVAERRVVYEKIRDLNRRHYEHLADIAHKGAQEASRVYIEELRKAQEAALAILASEMNAALAILASEIDARTWQKSLEGMYRQHVDNLAGIRDSYRESEQQKETARYRAIVAGLNEEYQARKKALAKQYEALLDNIDRERKAELDALKSEYGKAITGEGKREQLEKEHRRRLMGIYTESARKQEMKRHAAALKELEYEEKKAAIEEEYQERKQQAAEDYEATQAALEKQAQEQKEAATARHEAKLQRIAAEAQRAAIERENQRYRDEVNAARQRRALQQQDEARRQAISQQFEARRLAIIQQFEAQRQAERAVMRAREEAHQAVLEARRTAARQRDLADLAAALDKLTSARVRAYQDEEAAANAAKDRAREAKDAWTGWRPSTMGGIQQYQHGGITGGGTVLVGEAGPELLNLPSGTRVTPLTGGLAPVVIHNHFGAGSVRSERDIRRIAELQERTLRLRGKGMVS